MLVHDDSTFLKEAIESIINQSCGINNIQLILVDSCINEDNKHICLDYVKKYPDSIISLSSDNKGFSYLCNKGLKAAKGDIISFCDSNDMLSTDCVSLVSKYLQEHSAEIDALCIPDDSYMANGVINKNTNSIFAYGTRIIDLKIDYEFIRNDINGFFFIKDSIKNNQFDESLELFAAHKFIQNLLLKKMKVGILNNCSYLRREELNKEKIEYNKIREFYYESVINFYAEMIHKFVDKNKQVPKFVQNYIISEIKSRFRFRYIEKGLLTFDEEKIFWENIQFIFSNIDDIYFDQVRGLSYVRKKYLYFLKYGDWGKILQNNKNVLFTHDKVVEMSANHIDLIFNKIDLLKKEADIKGELCIPTGLFNNYSLQIKNGLFKKFFELVPEGTYEKMLGKEMAQYYSFHVRVPLDKTRNNIQFYLFCDEKPVRLGIENHFTIGYPLERKFRNDFYYHNGWKLLPFRNNTLTILPCSKLKLVLSFLNTLRYAIFDHNLVKFAKVMGKRLICKMPQKYILFESLPSFSDNALMVYNYFKEHNMLKDYEFVWYTDERDVILGNDYKNVHGFKTVFKSDAFKDRVRYKYYNLRSKAIIFGNRFVRKGRPDQIQFNLGHGSCLKSVHGHYDMPRDLDYLLIQSGFFEEPTRYEHSLSRLTETKVLGYPRNDMLVNYKTNAKPSWLKADKFIVWYPTWRQHSTGKFNISSVTIPLIHNQDDIEKINACAKENNVQIFLKPHFSQDLSYFNTTGMSNLVIINDNFFKENNIISYQMLAMSDALLTDYSSVYYDYLLANKPIGLVWEDFEEYKNREGFSVDIDLICSGGEKIYTTDDLCEFIVNVAKGNDKLKEQRNKINSLANAYIDGTSSQKVAEWIAETIEKSDKK